MNDDIWVVGAGLFGLTVARQCAEAGLRVRVLEAREHVGGNAHSYVDKVTGIEVHPYGTHVFHTSNARVWDFVTRFSSFYAYEHHVFTRASHGETYALPINLQTMSQYFIEPFTPDSARERLADLAIRPPSGRAQNLEERALELVGAELYQEFIRGYTVKQWGRDPRELPASIINRLPVRFSYDGRYFTDTWQGVPLHGYPAWFAAMLDHPLITVELGTPYDRGDQSADTTVMYTGPLDAYFGHARGMLPWRTIDLYLRHVDKHESQGTAVMNEAREEVPYTRTHEFRYLRPDLYYVGDTTVLAHEYARDATPDDEPYYPIRTPASAEQLQKYRALAADERNVFFGGRLGSYQYLDMHMAIASALSMADTLINWRQGNAIHIKRGGNDDV